MKFRDVLPAYIFLVICLVMSRAHAQQEPPVYAWVHQDSVRVIWARDGRNQRVLVRAGRYGWTWAGEASGNLLLRCWVGHDSTYAYRSQPYDMPSLPSPQVVEFVPDTLVATQVFMPQYRQILVPGIYTLGQIAVPEYPRLVVVQDTSATVRKKGNRR